MIVVTWVISMLAHNFHGCTIAQDGLHGWAVTLDRAAVDTLPIVRTCDGGMTWTRQQRPVAWQLFDVTCTDAYRAWACGMMGVILSTEDGGLSWSVESQGHTKYYTRIQMLDTLHGFAAGGDGVVGKKVGTSWQRIITPYYQTDFYGLCFLDTASGWLCGRPSIEAGGRYSHIVYTEDGGNSWILLWEDTTYDFLDIWFVDSVEGWVVGGNPNSYEPLIWHTTDGGLNWEPQICPTGSYYLRAVEFINKDTGWAVGMFGTILKTTDGGMTWSLQTSVAESTLFDVEFADAYRGIAVGNGWLLYTYDGGEHWYEGIVVGVNEHSIEPEIVIPNPFMKQLTMRVNSCNNLKLIVYDMVGRLVYEAELQHMDGYIVWDGTNNSGMEVSPGTYICILYRDDVKTLYKVVKLK